MRVILFDIDGTLIRSSGGSQAIYAALEKTFGISFSEKTWPMGGKTDQLIFREIAESMGVKSLAFRDRVPDLHRSYLEELESRVKAKEITVHAGVHRLLGDLEARGALLTLLTGNHPEGAKLKLSRAGIWERFSFGVYGHQTEDRNELPRMALELARERTGKPLDMGDFVVVGDTPRDVACARAGGCRVLAVATGGSSYEELSSSAPDLLVRTLEDPRCLEFLLKT